MLKISKTSYSFLQTPRPKPKITKRDPSAPQFLELLANDRQSQAGHMLLNLSSDPSTLIQEVCKVLFYLEVFFVWMDCYFSVCNSYVGGGGIWKSQWPGLFV